MLTRRALRRSRTSRRAIELDHRDDRLRPALLDRAVEIGRLGERELRPVELRDPARLDGGELSAKVLAARLDERSGGDADQLRLGAGLQIEDRLLEVVGAAEDGRDLVHRRRLERDRLLEVADEQDQREGRAALRAVEQRHGALDAEIGEGRAERLRRLQRIDAGGLGDGNDLRHQGLLTPIALK